MDSTNSGKEGKSRLEEWMSWVGRIHNEGKGGGLGPFAGDHIQNNSKLPEQRRDLLYKTGNSSHGKTKPNQEEGGTSLPKEVGKLRLLR